MNAELRIVGKSISRLGASEKLKGKAAFAADLEKSALVGRVLRSSKHHARILNIQIDEAKAVPGCVAIFTAKDIPGSNRFGIINKDQPLLADNKVRFVGDAIALIIAETGESAEIAARLVYVDYEDLPAVFDPEDALKPGATPIHEHGNLLGRRAVRKGNPEEAFKRADVIIEREYSTTFVEHAYLEPDAGLVYVDEEGIIVIHASTQNPHYDQKDVADLLDLPEHQVRIIQTATGGGFGSKLDLNVQGFVGFAAFKLKRPVRMVYTREEAFQCTSKRHPLKIHYKTAANKDGRISGVFVRIIGDTGAYASYGLAVVSRSAVHATGPYEIPNVDIESTFAYTNNPIAGAMRGFGVPQVAFAHETQMDLVAQVLGISPLEIRQRNCLRIGSLTGTHQELKASVGIGATLEAISPYLDEALSPAHSPYRVRGKGIGCMMYGIGNTGVQNPSTAQVELQHDGSIALFSGAAEIGQGSTTALSQIVAEEFSIDIEDIKLCIADTRFTTSAGATSASRQTYISGNAVLDAVHKLKDVMLTEAAMVLKVNRRDLVFRDGMITVESDVSQSISFQKIAMRAIKTGIPLKWQGFFDPDTTPLDPQTGRGNPYSTFAFATHLAEVEVDVLTGEVAVLRVVAAHDVGKAINPLSVHGQVHSGVAMGLGFALMEEYIPGKTVSFKDYHIPCSVDVPNIVVKIIEDPEPTGPYGAKGVGEPALIPTAPAILNAIANALGQTIYHLPANLERVLYAATPLKSKIIHEQMIHKT